MLMIPALFLLLEYTMAANWAQSSGSRVQNVVFTTNPSPGRKHWEGRYGASVVKHSDVSVSFATANDVGEIYIMGGDVYDGRNHSDQSIYRDPGLIDIFRTHGLKNDVWKTTGTEWTVKGDIRKTNGVKIK